MSNIVDFENYKLGKILESKGRQIFTEEEEELRKQLFEIYHGDVLDIDTLEFDD